MKLQLPVLALGAPRHLQALRALLASPTSYRYSVRLKIPLLPNANYHQASPAFAFSSSTSCSLSLSDNPNTIEFA